MRIPLGLIITVVLAVSACAVPPPAMDKPRDQMSERERDSTIAASGFAGSGVLKKALSVSAEEDKRSALYDSVSQ